MDKYFAQTWEYQDAADEGYIETTRAAPQFIHKFFNFIKLDEDEEGILWKFD